MQSLYHLLSLSIVALVFMALSGCSGGSSAPIASAKPVIVSLNTDIVHRHESVLQKYNRSPQRNIGFTIAAQITDPLGASNLEAIYFSNSEYDGYWTLLDIEAGIPLDRCYYPSVHLFECSFYDQDRLDFLKLEGWELVVLNKQGLMTTRAFSFSPPGSEESDSTSYVYSDHYQGNTLNGIPALEALEVADNNLVFSSNPGTQSFHIEFTPTDSRAQYYAFNFYDATASINYLGAARADAPSITSQPMVTNQTTSIDLPWSEIDFRDGYDATDVHGLHIVLFNTPSEIPELGIWFDNLGLSEYLTLGD